MLSWDDFDKNEEIKKEEPVENKIIEKSVIEKTEAELCAEKCRRKLYL